MCVRPSSGSGKLTTTVYRPKPRYAKPEVAAPTSFTSTSNFESTTQIREAAFQEWLAKCNSQFRRRSSVQTLKEKELEEQKAKVCALRLFLICRETTVWNERIVVIISDGTLCSRSSYLQRFTPS